MVQESDLLGFGRMVLHHLKKFRPNQYACLLKSGEVMDYCKEMEDYASAYLEKAQQQNVDYLTALEIAKETWLLLPDFSDDMQDSQEDDNPTPVEDNPSATERKDQ
ncbi:MAG: hypothetical protein JXB18_06330 [Sedimentisphaerales bacterium]|nr:hypothetical protein [Sedimentisphaerales bacterium]